MYGAAGSKSSWRPHPEPIARYMGTCWRRQSGTGWESLACLWG
jgi:hypothetical protein